MVSKADNKEMKAKIVVVGDKSVGKTCLITAHQQEEFLGEKPTHLADVTERKV